MKKKHIVFLSLVILLGIILSFLLKRNNQKQEYTIEQCIKDRNNPCSYYEWITSLLDSSADSSKEGEGGAAELGG